MLKSHKPVVYLQGGLGNQFFQYAFYLNLLSKDAASQIDAGRLIHDKQHKGVSVIDFLQLSQNTYLISGNMMLPYLIKDSLLAITIRYALRKLNIRTTRMSFYDHDAMSCLNDVCMKKKHFIGYFQFVDSALFSKLSIEKILFAEHKERLQAYSKRYNGKCGLHIRRGDFLLSNDSKHSTVELSYIKTAIKNSEEDIVVFSDDINWCITNLIEFTDLEFHCGNSAFDDFLALSQCSNYILSGSTFSWWAAFLFSSLETKVIYPKKHKAQFLSQRSNEKVGWSSFGL